MDIISGEEEAVEKLRSELTARGVETQRLQVSHTFHSPLMEPMLAGFEKVATAVRYQTAQVEMVSKVIEELLQPRSSFQGHTFETPWSDLQLAYFVGCAMWTYLNTPFLLVRPGIESEEIEPWQEAGETWRRLKVHFPADIATHSKEQTLYFDQQGLLKRHDYDVEISGSTPAAHYVSDLKEFSGIVFPTKHRIFALQPDGHAASEPLVVSIDMDKIVLF